MSKISEFIKTHPEITKWGVAVAGVFAVAGPLMIGLGLAAVAIGAISLPILGITAAVIALAAAIALISSAEPTDIKNVGSENLGEFGSFGKAAAGMIPKQQSEITVRLEAANGTSAVVTGTKGADVAVESSSSVGPTLGGMAFAAGYR